MMFQRVKVLWLGFWANLLGTSEARHQSLVAQGALQAHKGHLKNVREALTNLIFQRKKLQDQLQELDREVLELRTDLRQAAAENRDELALNLIARLETAQGEQTFLKTQVDVIGQDVEVARDTEKQLVKEITQADQMLGTLTSRHQALRVRKQLQSDLQSASRSIAGNGATRLSQPLADQIHRLEAELETMQTRREGWEKDWQAMRASRAQGRHHSVLDQIKQSLRVNNLPSVVVTERVR